MNAEALLFSLFGLLSIASGLGMVLNRDPVRAAMSLIVCFFSLACLYLLQSAELLAVLEVIVYAGAIMVLFVFVIMLVENKDDAIVAHDFSQRVAVPVKFLAVALVAGTLAFIVHRTDFGRGAQLPEGFGGIRSVGLRFFDAYLFHFEFTSLLLLAGIVGAVILSKRRRGGES